MKRSILGCIPSSPCNLYTHLTPDTPQCSHTLSSQVLTVADLSANTCWGQLNLWTSGWKNTSTQEKEGIWEGGGDDGNRRMKDHCVCRLLFIECCLRPPFFSILVPNECIYLILPGYLGLTVWLQDFGALFKTQELKRKESHKQPFLRLKKLTWWYKFYLLDLSHFLCKISNTSKIVHRLVWFVEYLQIQSLHSDNLILCDLTKFL